ncbi:hypothetical protein HU200_058605 [Digitaria exilis]|uniref:Cytochrome P450 n=1 Tax=Digitaria exilis TaxID=1010633 RepID=A0A835ACD1_9POAL|nr:hypothetical protein HU200_058605 [Digitaria exilis]
MDIPSLYYCSCLLLLLVLAHLLYSLAKCYYGSGHRGGLRLPPCPWQLPVIGSLHHVLGDLPHRSLRRLSRRYGPHLMLLRFGEVPVVVVSSGEAARAVMRTHDAAFATRPQTATVRILSKEGQAIALAPYGDHWRWLRKVCAVELLSAARVRSFQPVREMMAARLVGAVASGGSSDNKLVNLSEMMAAYVADTAVHAITGRRRLLHDRDGFLRYVDEAIRVASGVSLADLFPSSWIAGALSWRQAHKAEVYRQGLFQFLDAVITEHMERKSQDQLMRNPDVMSRAQAEVRGAFMSQSKVLEEGLSNLTYLHWVIKETLRLHTPVHAVGPSIRSMSCRLMKDASRLGATSG